MQQLTCQTHVNFLDHSIDDVCFSMLYFVFYGHGDHSKDWVDDVSVAAFGATLEVYALCLLHFVFYWCVSCGVGWVDAVSAVAVELYSTAAC